MTNKLITVDCESTPQAIGKPPATRPLRKFAWFFALFVVSETVFGAYGLAFYPGLANPDTADQWAQLNRTVPLDDWHPYVDTLWIGVLRLGTNSLGVATFSQLTLSAAMIAMFSAWLIGQGIPAWLVVPCHMLATLSPINAIYSIHIGKDTTSAQLCLALTLGWLIVGTNLGRSARISGRTARTLFLLALTTFGAAYVRHNNVLLMVLVPLIVWLLLHFHWHLKLFLTVWLLAFGILENIPLSTGFVANADVFSPNATLLWVASFSYQNRSSSLSADDRAFMETLAPPEVLQTTACTTQDLLLYGKNTLTSAFFNRENAPLIRKRLTEIVLKEVAQNPSLPLAQRICTLLPALGFPPLTYNHDEGIQVTQEQLIRYRLNWKNESVIPALREALVRYIGWTEFLPQRVIMWNHSIGLILLAIVGGVGLYKHNRLLIGIFLIYFVLFVFTVAIIPGDNWRYLYFLRLFSYFAVPIAVLPFIKRKERTWTDSRGRIGAVMTTHLVDHAKPISELC